MLPSAEPLAFAPSPSDISTFIAIRYFSVSALACCIWDVMICMRDEVAYIWAKPTTSWVTRFSYTILRYGIIGGIGYVLHVFTGLTPMEDHTQTCKTFLQLILLLVMASTIAANAYITYHHYLLWERRKGILIVLSVTFVCCYVPAVVLGFQAAFEYRDIGDYLQEFNVCVYPRRPKTVQAYFAASLAFDIIAILIATLNSFDKPYKRYGDVVSSLLRDGGIWFIGLSVLRVINLVLFVVMPPEQSFIVSFNVWAMISIMQSRFMLRVEELRRPHTPFRVWHEPTDAFELGRWSSR